MIATIFDSVRVTLTRGLCVASLVLVTGCGEAPETSLPEAALDSLVARALEAGPIAGAAVAIAREGQVVFERGYGIADLGRARPVTPGTRFNVASVGKVLAAATVMRLADAGRLDLDAPVADLLPELEGVRALDGVRLWHLLSMTSGLPDYVDADLERWRVTREPLTSRFVLDFVRDHDRVFEPGEQWMYSNTGFYLAGLAVASVTGRLWEAVVSDEVLPALGLEETGLCDEAGEARSIGYEVDGEGFVPSVQDQETGVRGDAGLCATVGDLARLPGRLAAGGVSATALTEMSAPTRLSSGIDVDYGLGIARGELFGHELWGHLGGAGSYVAVLGHLPGASLSIAVAVNTRYADVGALMLVADIVGVVLGEEPSRPTDRAVPDSLGRLIAGRYVGDRSRTAYEIVYDDERVFRIREGASDESLRLLWQEDQAFGRGDWPHDRFIFHLGAGGAESYSAYYNGFFDGFYVRTPQP